MKLFRIAILTLILAGLCAVPAHADVINGPLSYGVPGLLGLVLLLAILAVAAGLLIRAVGRKRKDRMDEPAEQDSDET